MSKAIHIGDVSIPLDLYVISGTALLGTKGAGKTYAAKGIAEQLLDYDVPIVVFDPIGRWRFMKIAGEDAKRPRGYKIVVAGGEQPDLPLTAQSAQAIVRAAIKENIPLVLDLYDRKLSKADWRRIVQTCFRTLLYENNGPRHIFLEETAEFAPQKIQDGETYAEVEKLVRMGGNASLGITLINQRAQEVNKAVLDLCENLVLMRQRGSHAIEALEKWIDKLDPESAKAITRAMPTMKAGEAWVFTGSAEAATHVQTAPIRSFHPDRSKPQISAAAAAARAADPAEFVSRLSGELEQLRADAEANDPAMLKKRIRELEKELADIPVADAEFIDEKAIAAEAEQRGFAAGLEVGKRQFEELRGIAIAASIELYDVAWDICRQGLETLEARSMYPKLPQWTNPAGAPANSSAQVPRPAAARRLATGGTGHRAPPRSIPPRSNGEGVKLGKAERSILTVLAQHRAGRTKVQIAILSGYSSSSSTFDNALGALRSAGYATKGGQLTQITAEGLEALGAWEPLPTGQALVDHWLSNLGKAERSILSACVERYPRAFSKQEIAEATGYSPSSSTFDNALGKLRTLELVQRGPEIRASEELFV